MSDLISRKVLIKKLNAAALFKLDNFQDGEARGLLQAKECVKDAPAVDAVEVVRCKSCCKWEDFSADKGWEGKGYCRFFECTTLSDDFCSCGERNEVSE